MFLVDKNHCTNIMFHHAICNLTCFYSFVFRSLLEIDCRDVELWGLFFSENRA